MLKYILSLSFIISINAAEFTGWEGLRVLPLEGGISASDLGDVDGSGNEQLFIANRRQSRIDIYKWLPPGERKNADKSTQPNDLPMAQDFDRSEIVLERPPFDILLKNFDEDPELELVVLTTLPLTLHLYNQEKGEWKLSESWKLPNENLQSLSILNVGNAIYISTINGILIQELTKGKQSSWMKPKETGIRRINWWEYDVDKDGSKDLVDLIVGTSDRVHFRWYKNVEGNFLPAIPLGDVEGTYGNLDKTAKEPTFFFQNPVRGNTVNEYTLEKDEESDFGSNRLLPVLNIREEQRTSIIIDGKKCLVEIDPDRPLMRVSALEKEGFKQVGNFPILRKTKAIAAPQGKNFILMQVGDSPDLYVSKWENGRFTYPENYADKEEKESTKLLGFGMHTTEVWWVNSVDDSLFLYLLKSGKEKPEVIEFKGIGNGLNDALWLGNNSLMVRKKYAKNATFYRIENGEAKAFQVAHLQDAAESQFKFFIEDGKLQLSRIIDGIIQFYGDDLQPVDQVMLEDGSKIIDAVQLDKTLYVLDQSGEKIHKLEKDKSGLMKEIDNFEVLNANFMKNDVNLGLLLTNTRYVNAVQKGQPVKFKLKNSITEKLGLPTGTKNAVISRFHLLDVAGTKRNEVLNVDFNRHQITLVDISGDSPKSLASWKVFDDGKYPYSDGSNNGSSSSSPYMIQTLDFDGDGIKELVMGCHDRLLIYLGKEVK